VEFRPDMILSSVKRLMERTDTSSVLEYLHYLGHNKRALTSFIKETTIHTTRWFRESKQLKLLEDDVKARLAIAAGESVKTVYFKVASFGCSSGQEVYSMAMVLEYIRKQNTNFDYDISGYDVDIVSIQRAKQAIYAMSEINAIPDVYLEFTRQGSNKTQGLFTLDKEIRSRCNFKCDNLLDENLSIKQSCFDTVFIRNILIYFTNKNATKVPLMTILVIEQIPI